MQIEERVQKFRVSFTRISQEIEKVIVGHEAIIEGTLVSIMAGGHVLLEGVPGLGKTLLVRTLSQVMGLPFSRICSVYFEIEGEVTVFWSVAGSIQAMTRPRTQYGARGAQALGEVFEPVAEGIQQASQYLGDVAFEKSGGSPLAGAAGYTTPEAILTILPATLLRRMVPSGNFLDRSGNPTPELLGALRQMGLSWDDLSAAAMREIPESPGRSLVTGTPMIERSLDPARAAQIRSGGSEGALAPLAAAGNRTIPDPMA